MVELVCLVPAGRGVRREFLRLPGLLRSAFDQLEALRRVPIGGWHDYVDQCPRDRLGGEVRDRPRDLHSSSCAGAGRDRVLKVAAQSVRSCNTAASAAVQCIRSRIGDRTLALLGLRAVFDGRGRSRKSAAQLPDGSRHRGSDVDRSLFSANARLSGCTRQLAELAYRLFS